MNVTIFWGAYNHFDGGDKASYLKYRQYYSGLITTVKIEYNAYYSLEVSGGKKTVLNISHLSSQIS